MARKRRGKAKAKATRSGSATAAVSTASSSLIYSAIVWYLMQMVEPGVELADLSLPVKLGVGCCACSQLSSIIRLIQYLIHFLTGIKTF
jgi:hypothetical protein